jgi:hypothetical protein
MTLLRAVRVLKQGWGYSPALIRFIVDRIHVATPDDQVREDFLKRSRVWRDEEAREALVVYALAVHHSNYREYARVMGGMMF